MGKGDKKSRRGKIIIGSSGVRRPKSSKSFVKVEVVKKIKKGSGKLITELKPMVKVAEPVHITETEIADAPEKAVKKALKKVKEEATE